mmetsp:Transcript_22759/g.38956  ORF Transcript_22759/g.38956 Transcript_22759/m.38956 type:complete len:269 (-) Transcript_22759:42-848(-)|eukprot:CAMPEP_0183756908 /NCGR_PEP_ID=MMETSP0739-20130205/5367_1 /TAXON_ID=385413 /ORGANISM="Thalassiosira miniscula, Strain CCMP1093" /LENGTH=268 /DNA_ID=CAMNT_0025994211 /DNA_START=82 /DNA_END=888 /DNA_ORIENTATION=+
MGKKRTNAAKKKQAAKKKKLSATYGVSVLKGGTHAKNNGTIAVNINTDSSTSKKHKGAASNGEGNSKNTPMDATMTLGRRSRGRNDENNEFQRMHASLEERSLALQARKDDQKRSKKERQKHQKKGWGKFVRPTNFAPATLTLAPKSTQQLVDDAADHVARGMNEIGQRAVNPLDGLSVAPGQSSLAAAASLNWQMRVSNVANQAPQTQNQNNSFAVLGDDSDSDNEWVDKKKKAVQQFQFKPASFSFQPAVSNTLASSGRDEIDPDL